MFIYIDWIEADQNVWLHLILHLICSTM